MNTSIHLFEKFGIELEYMIVDKDSLKVKPISDELIKQAIGEVKNTAEFGDIAWSNELVLHVIELKTNGPTSSIEGIIDSFQRNIKEINQILSHMNAKLLPTGMHPTMKPLEETVLWPYDSQELYATYNKIFDCRGHGWSNLQSIHLNLPFANDAEFAKLHTAIRLLLPILPALTASSPIVEGKLTEYQDNRLRFYRDNQKNIPSIAGKIIPEVVFSKKEYEDKILKAMYRDIAPYDPEGMLQYEWLNSRGACARFDRNAIELRLLDSQECVNSELAIVYFIVEVLKSIISEKWLSLKEQSQFSCEILKEIWEESIKLGADAELKFHPSYLRAFGCSNSNSTIKDLWQHVLKSVAPLPAPFHEIIQKIISQGNLAVRIRQLIGGDMGEKNIARIYQCLANCLENNVFLETDKACFIKEKASHDV